MTNHPQAHDEATPDSRALTHAQSPAHARHMLALQAARMCTWDWDFAKVALDWSENFPALYAREPESFGATFEGYVRTCVHPDDRALLIEKFDRARRDGADFRLEFRAVLPDGQTRWFEHVGKALAGADGAPERLLGATLDVTERKRVEAERDALLLRERDARRKTEEHARTKDEFLATLSHELRTPLNAILGYAQALRSGRLDDAAVAQGLAAIERNALHQTRLVDDLLDVSRIITGKFRLELGPLDLAPLVEASLETVRATAEAKGVRLHALFEPGAGHILGDAERVQQIVRNLLSNAVKFTAEGGHVRAGVTRRGAQIEIRVSDTGEGIEAAFLPHVFGRFRQADGTVTRAHGGLGLGLALVRQLVELHGGTVEAESPGKGHGASFAVRFPVLAERSAAGAGDARGASDAGRQSLTDAPRLDGVRVLAVDDDPDAREMLVVVLGACGAEVRAAASASEALAEAEQWTPHVLVSDIGMPGEDGYSLLGRLRALGPERGGRVPAVALTAYGHEDDRVRALAAGFQMHVAKPVSVAELALIVAGLAGRAPAPR